MSANLCLCTVPSHNIEKSFEYILKHITPTISPPIPWAKAYHSKRFDTTLTVKETMAGVKTGSMRKLGNGKQWEMFA